MALSVAIYRHCCVKHGTRITNFKEKNLKKKIKTPLAWNSRANNFTRRSGVQPVSHFQDQHQPAANCSKLCASISVFRGKNTEKAFFSISAALDSGTWAEDFPPRQLELGVIGKPCEDDKKQESPSHYRNHIWRRMQQHSRSALSD